MSLLPTCSDGYTLMSGNCYKSCPQGYIENREDKKECIKSGCASTGVGCTFLVEANDDLICTLSGTSQGLCDCPPRWTPIESSDGDRILACQKNAILKETKLPTCRAWQYYDIYAQQCLVSPTILLGVFLGVSLLTLIIYYVWNRKPSHVTSVTTTYSSTDTSDPPIDPGGPVPLINGSRPTVWIPGTGAEGNDEA